MLPLAFGLLVMGLGTGSLTVIYLSILCSIAWVPLLIVGLVKLARSRRTA
jgi:hypothetical protein